MLNIKDEAFEFEKYIISIVLYNFLFEILIILYIISI